ncbi:relaxase/mobilization nuclease domain-containing protein [Oscillospiraceae bacterium OttesenSCG-928-G22]|nr:relaxase/mobilization nuclease domain-containing protein [Oscillospiraceae bacterium OttesenSCG-928-G22]
MKGGCPIATTKIKAIKTRLDNALNYITNPEKTADGALVGSFNCRTETAHSQMMQTKAAFGKSEGRQGYHLIQSFKPGEITPDKAYEVAQEYACRYLSDKYEVVFSVHEDKEHVHAHIVWNAVSFVDGKKYHADNREYPDRIRRISDELCREHDLSVIENPKAKGKHYAERAAEKAGQPTIRAQIRGEIDAIIPVSYNFKNFVENLRKRGYAVKYGRDIMYMAVRPPYSYRYIRLKSLGEQYTEEGIKNRIPGIRRGTIPHEVPRQYRYRWPLPPKYCGLLTLLLYIILLLILVRHERAPRVARYALRSELVKFNKYKTSYTFLRDHKIETREQLDAYENKLDSLISAITDRRADLYRAKRRGADVGGEIDRLNVRLRELRKEKRVIGWINEKEPIVREKVEQLHEAERVRKEREVKKRSTRLRGTRY